MAMLYPEAQSGEAGGSASFLDDLLQRLSGTPLNVANFPGYAAGAAQFAGNAVSNIAASMSPVRFEDADQSPTGQAGFVPQVPPMVTETAGAWDRLFGPQDNWHDGPGEVYPGDQNADAATAAFAFYGGGALNHLRGGRQVATPAGGLEVTRRTIDPNTFIYDFNNGGRKYSATGWVDGDRARIEYLGAVGAEAGAPQHTLGRDGLKKLREEFRSDFPQVKTFDGLRTRHPTRRGPSILQSVEFLSDNKPGIMGSAASETGNGKLKPLGYGSDTGDWFLHGDKPVFTYGGIDPRKALDAYYGPEKAAQFDNYQFNDVVTPGTRTTTGEPYLHRTYYKPSEELRATQLSDLVANRTNDSWGTKDWHREMGLLLGYPADKVERYVLGRDDLLSDNKPSIWGSAVAGASREAAPTGNALASHHLEGSQMPMQQLGGHAEAYQPGQTPGTFQGQQGPASRGLIENDLLSGSFGVSPLEIDQLRQIYTDRGALPEGWYVHGRHGAKELRNDAPIQATRDYRIMEQYGGSQGSGWAISPLDKAKVLDFSNDTPDLRKLSQHMMSDYRKGKLPPQIEDALDQYSKVEFEDGSGHYYQTPKIEDFRAVAREYSPSNIVSSAQAFDDTGWINWLHEKMQPDFVTTPDGVVALGLDGIRAVRLLSDNKPSIWGSAASESGSHERLEEIIRRRMEGDQ